LKEHQTRKAAELYNDAINYYVSGGKVIDYKPPHIREELENAEDGAEIIGHIDLQLGDIDHSSDLPFDYSAINIMAELFILSKVYDTAYDNMIKGIAFIKRHLKEDESIVTEGIKNDFLPKESQPNSGIPVEIRVKIGITRLMKGELKEANVLFLFYPPRHLLTFFLHRKTSKSYTIILSTCILTCTSR
jgi:hypothetical protein